MKKIDRFSFGVDNDKLIELVLNGKKTATTYLYKESNIPKKGDLSILVYSNGKDACKIETINVIITEFKNITEDLAYLEGEGNRSLDYYKKVHTNFFKTIDKKFNEDTKVIFEVFKVIEKY